MTDPITDNFLNKVSNKPILLVGPTASGKSKLAMSLAIKLKRHIVNADSVQVYSNWRILTARPTSEDEKIKKNINLFEPHFKREKGTGRPTKRDRRQMEKYVDKFKNQ